MKETTLYEHVIKWKNRTNARQQDNMYKGSINPRSPGEHRYMYYELPEDYYGFKRRKQRSRQPKPISQQTTESPPRRHIPFSPLPPPRDPSRETTVESSRFPLIPVQTIPPNPPLFPPEKEAPPMFQNDTTIGPYHSTPVHRNRPEPIFPPLVPIDRADAFDRDYRRIVPGYNAVGSILRSLKMQGR